MLRFSGHDAAVQFAAQPDRAPSFGTANASAQNYLVGVTVSKTLPAVMATSGNGAFTYALAGPGSGATLTLPDGLRYAWPGRGTPTAAPSEGRRARRRHRPNTP